MQTRVDLNADMGESFGAWRMGDDAALLDVVTSANIACGFHAGDPDVMAGAMAAAMARGVGIGAHPGFADLQGFGRRRIDMDRRSLGNMVAYQLGAAQAMARAAGGRVRHLKLHGALANMAAADAGMARACYEAALAVDPEIIVMVLAGTAQEVVAGELGARIAREIFADRAYEDDGQLVDRRKPGAVIHDPDLAVRRILAMLDAGAIISETGKRLPMQIDTICLHGDGAEAVALARSLRAALEAAGVMLKAFDGERQAPAGRG
ncbi:LamB/YcsF family protein [Roseibacterium sp. SDUM158017]|uniref:LamB/YcsF family protein n=1 Tax=Roseicyclus salinarum TaxID=3036773 RepID=UPI002414DE4C|nr:5-oxoprolinase subunit PxpA [Roseibacterium sp. SDUM158017]MDG4650597.1 LamB/YcsF family protein [Roseibacterium sp. SDUM158017]